MNRPTRVMLVISGVAQSRAFEMLDAAHDPAAVELSYVLLSPELTPFERTLRTRGRRVHRIHYCGKRNALFALLRLLWLWLYHRPQVVHAHLFDASLWAITAAWLLGIRTRIFTRHYSTFHHDYHPQAVRYDRWMNARATRIVAISPVVERVLIEREGVPQGKVVCIPHGFDLREFESVSADRVATVRARHGIAGRPVIGAISRFTHWKGLQYLIPAFGEVVSHHPDALLVLANAVGEYTGELQALIAQHGRGGIQVIEFESDAPALYHCFDVFAHVPIDAESEAFGQVYVEALAAGRPMVCTLSGIGHSFVADGRNARVVPYQDSDSLARALLELIANPLLAQRLARQGQADVASFDVQTMARRLERLYRDG